MRHQVTKFITSTYAQIWKWYPSLCLDTSIMAEATLLPR